MSILTIPRLTYETSAGNEMVERAVFTNIYPNEYGAKRDRRDGSIVLDVAATSTGFMTTLTAQLPPSAILIITVAATSFPNAGLGTPKPHPVSLL